MMDERKRHSRSVINCKVIDHMRTHQLTQKQAVEYWQTETDERGAADSKTDSREVILVD